MAFFFPSPSKGEGVGGGVFKNPLLLSSSRQGRREPKPDLVNFYAS